MEKGDLVAANVRLDRLLSEGGMGSVWVADHLTLQTQVAVKFMTVEMARHPEAIARFKREASAAAQIKSPHIVQVFDHGLTAEGAPYIVMELLQGEDLAGRLRRGPLSLTDTLQVIRHLCKALGRAHQQGIVHRDIKPANIFLVEADGEIFAKVLDFGIAKRAVDDGKVSDMTRTGAMMGTPQFMSPEQVMSSKDIDSRSDLWAAGVVAYVCLTGVPPFDGETIGALSVAINAGQFVPASARVPELPLAVDAWFTRALARLPEDRYQSAKDMADAFGTAVPRDLHSLRPAAGTEPGPVRANPDADETMPLAPAPSGSPAMSGARPLHPVVARAESLALPVAAPPAGSPRAERRRIAAAAVGSLVAGAVIAAVVYRGSTTSGAGRGGSGPVGSTLPAVEAPAATAPPASVSTAAPALDTGAVPSTVATTPPTGSRPSEGRPPESHVAASPRPAAVAASRRTPTAIVPAATSTGAPSPPSAPAVIKDRGF